MCGQGELTSRRERGQRVLIGEFRSAFVTAPLPNIVYSPSLSLQQRVEELFAATAGAAEAEPVVLHVHDQQG